MYVLGFYLEILVWGEATLCNSARKFLGLATPISLLKPHDSCSANHCRHYLGVVPEGLGGKLSF